jgi:hypothetical protein
MKATRKTNSLLKTHNLSHTVNFATRIQNCLSTAIDDIFRDSAKLSSSCIPPIANSLSDHNAQFLTVNIITTKVHSISLKKTTTEVKDKTTIQFQHLFEN